MIELPPSKLVAFVQDGPTRIRAEHRWRVRTTGGEPAVLAQLLPELASEELLRRRYVYEARRVAQLRADAIAPILEIGPGPKPEHPGPVAPWRVRADPLGPTLAVWLDARAPAPIDEALELLARLAETVHAVHMCGGVLRDLEPRQIVVGDDDRIWLTDIGLARLDILSSRTASSLMLESSPYGAPEHLRATVVDSRADIYTLGAILWHALTGAPPFDSSPLLRDHGSLPAVSAIRPGVSENLDRLVRRCLAEDPDVRPESARDVARALSGEQDVPDLALERVVCQACGARLRAGLRLCLSCGKQSVQFSHAPDGTRDSYALVLVTAKEDEAFYASLRELFEQVGQGPAPDLNFLIGDPRLYSKTERDRLIKLPVRVLDHLPYDTAVALQRRLERAGVETVVRGSRTQPDVSRRWIAAATAAGALIGGLAGAIGSPALLMVVAGGLAGALIGGVSSAVVMGLWRWKHWRAFDELDGESALARLRDAPAALPASDPLVARLAALFDISAGDVRERITELALLVQRLVDHRARADDDPDIARVMEPIEPLIGLIEQEVAAIGRIDAALIELDEATLTRAIAVSEARREPADRRVELIRGLDRLRSFEDTRAGHLQRLLEASSLLRRAAELAIATATAQQADPYLAMARATLESD